MAEARPPVETMDDYTTAAQYLITQALTGAPGDGYGLRATKTLMDAADGLRAEVERLRVGLRLAHVTFGMILLAPGDKDGVIELAKEGAALGTLPGGTP